MNSKVGNLARKPLEFRPGFAGVEGDSLEKIIEECARHGVKEFKRSEFQFEGLSSVSSSLNLGASVAWLARLHGVQEVGGSNPLTQILLLSMTYKQFLFC